MVVEALLISTFEAVVISISLEFPWIFTPLAPLRSSDPDDVVKLDAAEASILTPAPASIVIAPVESISKTPASISTTELALALPSI